MALLRKQVGRQYVLAAEVTVNLGTDSAVNANGTVVPFNAAGSNVFDLIPMPPNATIIGGEVSVDVPSNDAGTATVTVGDSGAAARYLAATSTKTVARVPLVPTGYRGVGEDLLIAIADATGGGTQGVITVRVQYTVAGRANEAQTG